MKQKGKYPAIRIKRELYNRLKDLKYDLRLDTMTEVLDYLIDKYSNDLKKKADEFSYFG